MENKLLKDRGWVVLETSDNGVTYAHEMWKDLITIELEKDGKVSLVFHPMSDCGVIVLTEEELHGINQVVNQLKYQEDAIEPIDGGVNHDRYEV